MTVRRADGEGTLPAAGGRHLGGARLRHDRRQAPTWPKRRARTPRGTGGAAGGGPEGSDGRGEAAGPASTTAEEWLRHWIFTIRVADPECSPNTLEGYVTDCEQYIWL